MVTRHPRPTTLFTSRTMAKNLLEETLDAWGYARTGVIDELENIPASDFGFRPSPHSRTTAELAAHIIESGLLASGELTRKDGNFQRQSYPEFIEEYGGDRERDVHVYFVLSTRMQKGPAPRMPRWIDRSVRLEPDQFPSPIHPQSTSSAPARVQATAHRA